MAMRTSLHLLVSSKDSFPNICGISLRGHSVIELSMTKGESGKDEHLDHLSFHQAVQHVCMLCMPQFMKPIRRLHKHNPANAARACMMIFTAFEEEVA